MCIRDSGNSSEKSGLEEVSRVESPTIRENRLAAQRRRQATLRSRGPTYDGMQN